MKPLALFASLVLLIATGCPQTSQPTTEIQSTTETKPTTLVTAKVVGVVDGDTMDVLLPGNIQQRLRLNGIDTPERGQPFGNNAKKYLSELTMGKQIEFEPFDTDRYDRVIAETYVSGNRIGLLLVEAGLAWQYEKYSDDPILASAQQSARERQIGLWSDPRFVAPWEWRKLSKEERDKLR